MSTSQRVVRTEAEWRAKLSPEEYEVLRQAGTDRPHSGEYNKFLPKTGHFVCKGCSVPLYSAGAKFACSCGWPAFDKAYTNNVGTRVDSSGGYDRIELICGSCESHLGHVFEGEGMTPTNQRHCINSSSLSYLESEAKDVTEGLVKA